MFIVILDYVHPLEDVDPHLDAHREWVARGYADGVFALSGPQRPRIGGAIIAHGVDRPTLEHRLAEDPFRTAGVATHRIIEVAPTRTDTRMAFLVD